MEDMSINNTVIEEPVPEPLAPDDKSIRKRVNHIFLWLLIYNIGSLAIAFAVGLLFPFGDEYILSIAGTVIGTALLYLCTYRKWPVRPFDVGHKRMNARDFCTLYGLFCVTQLITIGVNVITYNLGIEGTSIDMGEITIWLIAYALLIGPMVEELIYRGFVIGNGRQLGKITAIVLSAFAFGLMHGNLSQFVVGLLAGLILGYAFTEYSIWWALALHLINNGIGVASMLVPEQYYDLVFIATVMMEAGLGIFAIVQLINHRDEIKAWFLDPYNHGPEGVVRSVLTSPWFIVFTVLYVATIILLMVFPEFATTVPAFTE